MTGTDLREELERIAAGAPVAHVPADTFARGRRARRRQTLLTVAASVVAVALTAGVVAGVAGRSEGPLPADAPPELGVPSIIWDIPPDADLGPASSDLAIGRGAVAQISADGRPVVVGDDGTHHLLRLPGFQASARTLSLSPDGRSLAWGWTDADASAPLPLEVRVADLMTGEVREVALGEVRRPYIYRFSWSPDSRWLLWEGAGDLGRIAPGADRAVPVPGPSDDNIEFSIDDDGLVLVAGQDVVLLWDGDRVSRETHERGWYPAVTSTRDGVLVETIQRDGGEAGFRTLHRRVVEGEVVDQRIESLADAYWTGQLGLVDGTHVLVNTFAPDQDTSLLQLIDLSDPLDTTTTAVAEVRSTAVTSVAVDLMTVERPTVERPAPSWVADGQESGSALGRVLPAGLVAVALLAGAAAWWVRRRRARRGA